jgi:hypothetical protein
MVANGAGWSALVDNDAELYAMYSPPIVQSACAVAVTATGYTDALEWKVPQNEDDLVVRVEFRWKVSGGGTAYCECDLADGSGTDTATSAAFTTATETAGTLNITPSNSAGSSTPRTLTLKLKTSAGTVELLDVCCYLVAATAATGTTATGFKGTHTGWYSTDEPVPSEVAQRLIDNPKRIAEDRPAVLVSVLDDISADNTRAAYTTAASGEIARFMLPPDAGLRTYRVAYRIDRDVGVSAHAVVVYVGPHQFPTTSTGWTMSTQIISGELFQALKCNVVAAVTGGTGNVYLRALQIMREPA